MLDVSLRKALPGFALDVSFRSDARLTALFGRSGSGKSLVLGLIAGIARPDAGRVAVDGTVLLDTAAGLCVPMHRRRIGLVFQDAQLFPHLSVRANLAFGRWFAGRRGGAVAFDQVVDTLGLGALLGRYPSRLSGGERQRVAIGRALLASPRLLLFDEPLAALDRQRKLDILPLIERLRDEFAVPVLYVTHALEEVVRLAATVVVVERGTVAAMGAPERVLGAAQGTGGVGEGAGRRFGLFTVLAVTAGPFDAAFGLTALDHPAGRLWLAGPAGPAGRPLRALVRATDVSLAPGATGPISIRSALAGRVATIAEDGPLAAVTVALDGGGSLVALVTRRALHDLGLGPGAPVNALVKTVALDEAAAS